MEPTRRRRRRATAPQGPPAPVQPTTEPPAEAETPAAKRARKPRHRQAARATAAEAAPPPRKRPSPPRDNADRGLRDLVGGGPSALGVSGALRARDVDRPSAEDLAAAERDLVIVRRNWRPPTD